MVTHKTLLSTLIVGLVSFSSHAAEVHNADDSMMLYTASFTTAKGKVKPQKGNVYSLNAESGTGVYITKGNAYTFDLNYLDSFDDESMRIPLSTNTESAKAVGAIGKPTIIETTDTGYTLFAVNTQEKKEDDQKRQMSPEIYYSDGNGEVKPPRKNRQSNRSPKLSEIKGLPSGENAAWSYKVTDISPDGKVIIGIATATQDYERADRQLNVKKGTQVAVYWTEGTFLKQYAVSNAKPLAIELDQPKVASNNTINKVNIGLTRAFDVVEYNGSYLISGRAHDGSAAILELKLPQ